MCTNSKCLLTVRCRCSLRLAAKYYCAYKNNDNAPKKKRNVVNENLPPTPHTPLGVLEWNPSEPVLMSRTCLTLLCLALCWSCVYTSRVASSLLLPSSCVCGCVCGLVPDPLFFISLFRPAVWSWEFLACCTPLTRRPLESVDRHTLPSPRERMAPAASTVVLCRDGGKISCVHSFLLCTRLLEDLKWSKHHFFFSSSSSSAAFCTSQAECKLEWPTGTGVHINCLNQAGSVSVNYDSEKKLLLNIEHFAMKLDNVADSRLYCSW